MAPGDSERLDHRRDGTSQSARLLPALHPDYVHVDERSTEDLLVFTRSLAGELVYFDETDEVRGSWDRFLDPDLALDEIAALLEAPEEAADGAHAPHLALFLAYLGLLGRARGQLNALTRRHLEFYYESVLGMTRRSPVPDRVNVLFELAAGVQEHWVPAGTLLDAGPDDSGTARVYRTEGDVVVNGVSVEALSAVHVAKRVTDVRAAREDHDGPAEEGFMRMLEVALGDPAPGGPLPPFGPPIDATPTFDDLRALHEHVLFLGATTGLSMELFELRALMRLKERRAVGGEWPAIRSALEAVGAKRSGDDAFALPADLRDFDAGLEAALGQPPDFDGITLVEDIDDLYEQRLRAEVQDFVREELSFETLADFEALMQLKLVVDNEWREINRILEVAGRRKRDAAGFVLSVVDQADFDTNLPAALGDLDFPGAAADIDAYWAVLERIEAYFHMPADDFDFVMSIGTRGDPPATDGEWERVYEALIESHQRRVYFRRGERLEEVHVAADGSDAERFDAMLHFALGEDPEVGETAPLSRLADFVQNVNDLAYLQRVSAGASEVDWPRVYGIVELAWRNRDGLLPPVPRKEEWQNLYPAADATAVLADRDDELAYWRTFGQRSPEEPPTGPPEPSLGWAIDSPLLELAEGDRKVVVALSCDADGFDAEALTEAFAVHAHTAATESTLIEALAVASPAPTADDPFLIEISTEKGWVEPDGILVTVDPPEATDIPARGVLTFALRFGVGVDPIVRPPEGEGFDSHTAPVLRFRLRQSWSEDDGLFVLQYASFRHLVLTGVDLTVDVEGLRDLVLRNDDGPLDPAKPFEPFGPRPAVGSKFRVGHRELIAKPIGKLTFDVEWMGVPAALEDETGHYRNYAHQGPFKADVSAVVDRAELGLRTGAKLFVKATPELREIKLTDTSKVLTERDAALATTDEKNLLLWPRYLRWRLTPNDFHHRAHAPLVAEKALKLASVLSKGDGLPADDDEGNYLVNPPYTPAVQQLSVSYTASVACDLQPGGEPGSTRVIHLHPFGHHDVRPDPQAEGVPFLPQYDDEGELYIGLSGLDPAPGSSRRLSVLFQMADGSADASLEPVPVRWSRLSGDRWLSLDDGAISSDSTRGLINSGIIVFDLPAALPSRRMPGGLYWIRATIAHDPSSVCDAVAIHTQAVSAVFVDAGNDAGHYSRPLPSETITDVVEPKAEIKKVVQPYTSFGGRAREEALTFYTRISERLRHKQRALTAWDYERLVLDNFPSVYKVKCLRGGDMEHAAAGAVDVVVIPNVREHRPSDPFEPKAPTALLASIRAFLQERAATHAVVAVSNPNYVKVKVRVGVRFRDDQNPAYFQQLLNDELNRYLSPWAYEEGADIAMGGRIYANSIVDFLDGRPYVDYVAHIHLFTSEDGRSFERATPSAEEGTFVTTNRPDQVLVCARQHEIDLISEAGYQDESFTGINYMKVELDFIVD